MKIAVTYENGQVFQHFGHTQQFKVYTAEDGKILSDSLLNAGGSGHGALAGFLRENGVDVLICGGIGEGAKTALKNAGITLVAGASGNADEQAAAFVAGTLRHDPSVTCHHHDHDHGDGGHTCGSHGCGHGSCGNGN